MKITKLEYKKNQLNRKEVIYISLMNMIDELITILSLGIYTSNVGINTSFKIIKKKLKIK